jgi:hypothetical protein
LDEVVELYKSSRGPRQGQSRPGGLNNYSFQTVSKNTDLSFFFKSLGDVGHIIILHITEGQLGGFISNWAED